MQINMIWGMKPNLQILSFYLSDTIGTIATFCYNTLHYNALPDAANLSMSDRYLSFLPCLAIFMLNRNFF